jgi:hypothetical protein
VTDEQVREATALLYGLKRDIVWKWPRTDRYRLSWRDCVWNRDLNKYLREPELLRSVKWIICPDNPGAQERMHRRYLSSREERSARWFAEQTLGADFFDESVMILNKTPLSSRVTTGLAAFEPAAVRDTQVAMARLMVDLLALTRANLWILGVTGCKWRKGWPELRVPEPNPPAAIRNVVPFYKAFRDLLLAREDCDQLLPRVFITYHFSRDWFGRGNRAFKVALKAGLVPALSCWPIRETLFPELDCEHDEVGV